MHAHDFSPDGWVLTSPETILACLNRLATDWECFSLGEYVEWEFLLVVLTTGCNEAFVISECCYLSTVDC